MDSIQIEKTKRKKIKTMRKFVDIRAMQEKFHKKRIAAFRENREKMENFLKMLELDRLKLKRKQRYQLTGEMFYNCNICKQQFLYESHLQAHEKLHITEDKGFSCKSCSETFECKNHLHKHKKIHADMYTCQMCYKKFYEKNKLQAHKLFFHSEFKSYSCPSCDNKYIFNSSLHRHLKVVHASVQNHACFKCDRKFSTEFYMELHMLEHINEKPFSCKVCFEQFKTQSDLQEHIRNLSDPVPVSPISRHEQYAIIHEKRYQESRKKYRESLKKAKKLENK